MIDEQTVALLVLLTLAAKTTKANPDKLVSDSIEISKIFMEEINGKRK
jgi:hypothetical protein